MQDKFNVESIVFSQMVLQHLSICMKKKKEPEPKYCTSFKMKLIIDHGSECKKYIYILEENVRENHHDLKLCKEFLEITQKG